MSTTVNGPDSSLAVSDKGAEQKIPYPGIPTTADGAGMVVWAEVHVTQGACAYPITSSTTMGGGYQAEVANGKHNLWGEDLAFIEPERLDGFAVADDGDGVCDFADFVEFVADDDAGDALALQVQDEVQEVAGVLVVERSCRLIKDEELDLL